VSGFHVATPDEIRSGRTTDVYFRRTLEVLEREGKDPEVTAEVRTVRLPRGWEWGILAGIEEVCHLLGGARVDLDSMREGSLFRADEPVLMIHGRYRNFAEYETPLLGLLCQASGVATKAARCRRAAGDRLLVNFGARRMHPAITPMLDRSSYIGGCDAVSAIKGAEVVGVEPTGTMPHALVLIMGDTVAAAQAFHRDIEPTVKRIVLIDTFNDEQVEAVRVAGAMGSDLYAVRLDTPGSRRGNFAAILQEVRWELDLRGFRDVKLFVSGGIDEDDIVRLNAVADAYGVGTSITSAPVIDFSLDIVEVDGEPRAKRGKRSGAKRLLACARCGRRWIAPRMEEAAAECDCGGTVHDLLEPQLRQGELAAPLPTPQEIRAFVIDQIASLEEGSFRGKKGDRMEVSNGA
jgi:nicotinate phosphoribosyltransferase